LRLKTLSLVNNFKKEEQKKQISITKRVSFYEKIVKTLHVLFVFWYIFVFQIGIKTPIAAWLRLWQRKS